MTMELVQDSVGTTAGEERESVQQGGGETGSGLQNVLEAHRGERHVIVLQDFPDPDAISSAFAHQLISSVYDIEADILFAGKISHQQNIALVKLLGIQLIHFDGSSDLTGYKASVFVDNQGTTANTIRAALEGAGVPLLIVVDHHEAQEPLKPVFSDIRRTAGATATIYAGYLEQGLVKLEKNNKEHVLAATALMHGIITDTGGFIHAGPEDFHAAAYLSQFRDAELLDQIMSQSRTKKTMEIIHRALGNRLTVENITVSGIGYLRAEDRDAIPQAADFLLTEENVHTAIVYGIVAGDDRSESVVGSMRTTKVTLDSDQFIKETFGKDAAGHYFGGGKHVAGGFAIPVGFLSGGDGEEYREVKWKSFDTRIKHKIFAKIGVEPPP
jgi:nanoRNase/pAp phosphatase (c-di-AMP/oligoRNAs hydrolase)